MKYVKIIKIGEAVNPDNPAHPLGAFPFGQPTPDGYSIPVDYWVEGWIPDRGPKVGEILTMDREIRNGVEAMGLFETTPVVEVSPDGLSFRTKNSVYKIAPSSKDTA